MTTQENTEWVLWADGTLAKTDRGNDLCEIIYSLMDNNGPTKLTTVQRETVQRIKTNMEKSS